MLHPDYRDMLVALSDHNADFIVIGAYAMAAHGLVRATADIDIWVRPSQENANRVWAALGAFGAPLHLFSIDDLTRPGVVFQIGVQPVRIDLLTQVDGLVDFDEAMAQAQTVSLDALKVPILSRHHLILNKRATGRPKDLNDVQWLESQDSDNK